MAEQQNVDGDQWLDKTIEILNALGWAQHGDKKVDILISSKKNKKKYGIDAYFTYYDPYEISNIGIIIEAKTRQWQSVNSSFIKETVEKMADAIQDVPLSDEFNSKLNFNAANKVNTCFILVWVNDSDFESEKFEEYLQKIDTPNKRNTQRIFIASNKEILRFCSIIETAKEFVKISSGSNKEFTYYFPSLSGVKNEPKRQKQLTLEYLYSKYIFGKMMVIETAGKTTWQKDVSVVLYSDVINLPSLKLMYSALIRFQLLDVDEIWIYFYNNSKNYRSEIEEFKRFVTSKGKEVKFKFEQMITVNNDIYLWRSK